MIYRILKGRGCVPDSDLNISAFQWFALLFWASLGMFAADSFSVCKDIFLNNTGHCGSNIIFRFGKLFSFQEWKSFLKRKTFKLKNMIGFSVLFVFRLVIRYCKVSCFICSPAANRVKYFRKNRAADKRMIMCCFWIFIAWRTGDNVTDKSAGRKPTFFFPAWHFVRSFFSCRQKASEKLSQTYFKISQR